MTGLNTLERDDILRKIAWQNDRIDKIERMLKGEQVSTARIADAAITNAKIKDLTWDKARGGTATLGGLNNVDGILSINDSSGVEKVVLDKDGILVKDGKITIKNGDDVSIIDQYGIISNNVFPVSSISGSPYSTIDSSTYVTVGIPISFTLTRSINALVILSMINASQPVDSGLSCSGRNIINVNSSVDGDILNAFYDSYANVVLNNSENTASRTYSYSNTVTLSPGSHEIELQIKIDSIVNIKTIINGYSLSIILLGS